MKRGRSRREERCLGALVVVVGLCACDDAARAPRAPTVGGDVVLIVLDTVRRDRLSTYGYPRPTSPALDAFRREARLYQNAHATSSWTAPSHASIFTGLYPHRHGATQESWALARRFHTLAERLARAGYQTVAAVGNPMLTPELGFAQGFEVYRETWRAAGTLIDPGTVGWVDEFLAERRRDRPLFLFVNLIGAHSPFDSCGESCGLFGTPRSGALADPDWRDLYNGRLSLADVDLQGLGDLYDAEVREVDRNLGRLLHSIDAHSDPDTSFVVVTSDHGENLGEHGHIAHVFSLYETTVQVPLVVRNPMRFAAGSTDAAPTELVDLFATILEVAGAPAEASTSQGQSLMGLRTHRASLSEYYRPIQTLRRVMTTATPAAKRRLARYWRRIRTISADGWKLHWGDDGRNELYDLRADPAETHDLFGSPEALPRQQALESRLSALIQDATAATDTGTVEEASPDPAAALDSETREQLRLMGYVD